MFFRSKNKKRTKITSILILFLLVFNIIGQAVYPKEVKADLPVIDTAANASIGIGNALKSVGNAFQEIWKDWTEQQRILDKAEDHWAAVAFKATLHAFLKKLSIDTATWIATGGKGQKPMFETRGWGAYLADLGDQAAGEFVITAANEWGEQSRTRDSNDFDLYQECMNYAEDDCNERCITVDVCMQECLSKADKECREGLKIDYTSLTKVSRSGRTPFYSSGMAGNIVRFLCEPDMRVKLRITAGLSDIQRPRAPRCTASKAMKNWDKFVNDKNFLNRFQYYWDPWENDIGAALILHSNFLAERNKKIDIGKTAREQNQGIKDVTDYAGKILTPATYVKLMGGKPIKEGASYSEIYTSDIIADAVGTFASTLMGKLLNQWVRKGMVKSGDLGSGYDWSNSFVGVTQASREVEDRNRAKSAQEKFAKIFKPHFNEGKAYSVLQNLMSCPDPSNPGPTECVIDEKFAQAVQEKLTVKEAIEKGYISTEVPFGFTSNGVEPAFNEGYPYRSLIILRKYRIIPVSWEIVAKAIKEVKLASGNPRSYNIAELADSSYTVGDLGSSLDFNWVLKAPETFCGYEGYGEQIISSQIVQGQDNNDDGDYEDEGEKQPELYIARGKYCADEKSCIKEGKQGKCLFYGYCTEEKRKWNFKGEECDKQFNSCQGFTSPKGDKVYFTKNSLDYNSCNETNVGCKEYCGTRNRYDDSWVCTEPESELQNFCDDLNGCDLVDADDIDQDGDISESCHVNYGGSACRLTDSNAFLYYYSGAPNDIRNNIDNDYYFDSSTEECSRNGEGCHEYIRIKPNLGTNLIVNPSFEGYDGGSGDSAWTITGGGDLNIDYYSGKQSYHITSDRTTLEMTVSTNRPIAGRKFILSFYAKNCDNSASFSIQNTLLALDHVSSPSVTLENHAYWQRFSTAYYFPKSTEGTDILVQIANLNAGCFIDAVQLEEVMGSVDDTPSNYNDYGEKDFKIYLKKAPWYYHCDLYNKIIDNINSKDTCLSGGGFWREDIEKCVQGGTDKCKNFTPECSMDEVGCDLFRPLNNDPDVPAIVDSDDYCPEECNGYSTYKQERTFFEAEKFPEFFIPSREKQCSSRYEGCTEFTNLDELKQGGEAVDYYTYLRPCQDINANCATFYTWVGSKTTGYQLKAFSLKDANHNNVPDSLYDENDNENYDSGETDPTDFLGSCEDFDDAITNPECYQFYSEDGNISYRLYRETTSCSDQCHPFRKTDATKDECENSWGKWEEKDIDGNGTPDIERCIYTGLKEQSVKCPKSQNRCYEYKGDFSNNIRKIIDDNFEKGELNWTSSESIAISEEAVTRGGHSLHISPSSPPSSIQYPLKEVCDLGSSCNNSDGCLCPSTATEDDALCYVLNGERTCVYKDLVREGKSYIISFWAKGTGTLDVKFSSAPSGEEFTQATYYLSDAWQQYTMGPVFVSWDMSSDDPSPPTTPTTVLESLQIGGIQGDSYIDNIILKEIKDNLFIIRPSVWNVPRSCDRDLNDNYAPQYMLGCKEYQSRMERSNVFLKSFNKLCSEEVVGCEALIDTFNSTTPFEKVFNDDEDISRRTIPADRVVSLVNDSSKRCGADEKGCRAFGKPIYRYNQHNTFGADQRSDDTSDLYRYETVYLKDDPDKYDEIMCKDESLGCDKFDSDFGVYYFKDPSSQQLRGSEFICNYKKVEGQDDYGWYIKNTNSAEANCPLAISDVGLEYPGKSCLGGSNAGNLCSEDIDCPGGKCINWTAECPISADTCTEYLDPVSDIGKNIVFNSNFLQDVDGNNEPDGWTYNVSTGTYHLDYKLRLKPGTVYTILTRIGNGTSSVSPVNQDIILNNCDGVLGDIDNSMTFTGNGGELDGNAYQLSGRFYSGNTNSCYLNINDTLVNAIKNNGGFVKIVETGIYYYLDDSIDTSSCNGFVDYPNGCVLFNKREVQNGGDLLPLSYNADLNTLTPSACDPATSDLCDSNQLIKVYPDRDCGEWLACKSIVEYEDKGDIKQYCVETGLCSSLDDQGACDYFIMHNRQNLSYPSAVSEDDLQNMSGYVEVGYDMNPLSMYAGKKLKEGMFSFDKMEEVGSIVNNFNGNFELSHKDGHPMGWNLNSSEVWDRSYFRVISNPVDAGKEGIDYPMEGKNFLKFSPSKGSVISDYISVGSGEEYTLSAFVNTINFHPADSDNALRIKILTYNGAGSPITGASAITECLNIPDAPGRCSGTNTSCANDSECTAPATCIPDNHPANLNSTGACGLAFGAGKNWGKKVQRFRLGPNTQKIRILIEGTNYAGNVYLDDVKVAPALYIRNNNNNLLDSNTAYKEYLVPQTCRAYPRADSLSCKYFDKNGIKNVGRYGYCLRYDHYPGNPRQCLIWWPSDIVRGEDVAEEGAFYNGRYPVYYGVGDAILSDPYQTRWQGEFILHAHSHTCEDCGGEDNCVGVETNIIPTESAGDLSLVNHNGASGGYTAAYCTRKTDIEENTVDNYSSGRSFRRSDISYIEIRGIIYDDDGTQIAYLHESNDPNNNWVYRTSEAAGASGTNCWAYSALFDDNDNFERINFAVQDCSDHPTGDIDAVFDVIFHFKRMQPTTLIETVNSYGENKYWSNRVYEGSNYITPHLTIPLGGPIIYPFGNVGSYRYNTFKKPFGSIDNLEPDYDPTRWMNIDGTPISHPPYLFNDPLMTEKTFPSDAKGSYVGQSWGNGLDRYIKLIFAQSYNIWQWDNALSRYVLQPNSPLGWSPPEYVCPGNPPSRPSYDNTTGLCNRTLPDGTVDTGDCLDGCDSTPVGNHCEYCGIPPRILNIKINDVSSGDIRITNTSLVNLTFNTRVDINQLPLVMYSIDWGDGRTTVSGIQSSGKSNEEDPFSLYHIYSYWDMLSKNNNPNYNIHCAPRGANPIPAISCPAYSPCCVTEIRTKVKDNWDWCNHDTEKGQCNHWDYYQGYIEVDELEP